MRFYRFNRHVRIGITISYALLMCGSLAALLLSRHVRHPWSSLIWLCLGATQISNAWIYWDITDHALVAHSAGLKGSTPFAQIRYVGAPRSGSSWLKKAIEVERLDRGSIYVTTEEREVFCDTLRQAVGQPPEARPPVGILGL